MSNVVFQNIPNRKDVANGSAQNKEMEDGMHVRTLVEGIEQGSGDVADSFADVPTHGMRADGIHQCFDVRLREERGHILYRNALS